MTQDAERERAHTLLAEIGNALEEVCKVMDKAKAAGFTTQFKIDASPTGRAVVTGLKLSKEFMQ